MTEAFDLMSNSIFDNIVNTEDDQDINLDDIWKSDLSSMNIDSIPLLPTLDDFCRINNIDIAAPTDDINKFQEEPHHEIIHDCMWSGTCKDKDHPTKKKNFRYCSIEKDKFEDSDMDLDTEIMMRSSSPSTLSAFTRNMQNDPVNTFQEIIQSAQLIRNYATPAYPKVSNHQLPHLPQTYQNASLMFQNPVPPKIMELPCETTTSNSPIIKTESIKFEPIPAPPEPFQLIPEQQPIQQMFFYNQESIKATQPQIIPYYPQVKYEPVNVMPQFYYPYPPEFDTNGNQICHVNENGFFKNIQFTVVDQQNQNQKQPKVKQQNKRKTMKKTKVKEKKSRLSDTDLYFGEGSMNHQRLRQSTGSDENPIEKRSMHNSMERQRRIGLKNLFIELKEAIPTLDERERVPKVSILREAIAYCQKINADEKLLDDLKKKHNKLMTHFHKLHRSLMK